MPGEKEMATKQPSVNDASSSQTATPASVMPHNTPAVTTTTYIDLETGLPTDASAPTPPAAEKADEKQATGKPDGEAASDTEPEERLFSQAEVEKIIKDRLDRQRRRYEQLEAKATTEEAEPSAGEQAAPSPSSPPASTPQMTDDVKAELAQIRTQLASVSVEVTQARIGQVIAVEAQRLGVDAGLAAKLIDSAAVEVTDGKPKPESVAAAIKALVEQYPNLRTMPGLSAANPARTQQRHRTDDDRRSEYFGGGRSDFWYGGGLADITTQQEQ